jgi:uncharacterized protein (TIGR02271 family)
MARTAIGYFPDRPSADRAYQALLDRGFSRDDVSVIGRGREDRPGLADDDHVSAGEGVAIGGVTGLLLGAAAMLIPGIGPVVAAGPIAAGLAGALTGGVTGAVVGGITGALIDAGVSEDEARYYDERFQKGGVLVTVRADGQRYFDARTALEQYGADVRGDQTATPDMTADWDTARARYRRHFDTTYSAQGGRWEDYEPTYRYGWEMRRNPQYHGRQWTDVEPDLRRDWESRYHDKPWDRFATGIRHAWDDDDSRHLELHEERLRPEKETVETGQVNVRKEVVTEQESMEVPVTREEVYVERQPVAGGRPASGDIGEDQEIRVPVREETVHLEKDVVVSEDVTVGKRPVRDTEHVSGTVRREEAHVETDGDVNVRRDDAFRNRP